MNLCNFCIYKGDYSVCVVVSSFVRPTGQRVLCCNHFEQYPHSYADMLYYHPKLGYDFNSDRTPEHFDIIGCIGSKPSKKEPKKNQVQFKI